MSSPRHCLLGRTLGLPPLLGQTVGLLRKRSNREHKRASKLKVRTYCARAASMNLV